MRANRRDRRSMLMQANNVGQGAAAATPWEASIHIDGTTFSTTELLSGFPGARDDTSDATKTYFAAATSANLTGGSLWSAVIKGTGATLVFNQGGAYFTDGVYVSVDGGAFANIVATNVVSPRGEFVLFSGLSDAEHYVVVRIGIGFGTSALYWDDATTDALVLTGSSTYIEMCDQWVYAGVTSSHSVADGATKNSTANFTPAKTLMETTLDSYTNIPSARIRGRFRSIQVACSGGNNNPFAAVWVSKDGAAPSKYSFTSKDSAYTYRVTGLDESLATYTVWTDYWGHQSMGMFAISGDADHVDIGDKKRIHQFGDSITAGNGNSEKGEVEVFRIGASMGYVATTIGKNGLTIGTLETVLDTWLAGLTVTSSDVAILAIGRNNIVNAPRIDATVQASYDNILDKLVAKGYGKIIVRSVLPNGPHTDLWDDADQNPALESVVATLANANVVWLDASTCPSYVTVSDDETHPTAAGYATVAAYLEPLYRTILGL